MEKIYADLIINNIKNFSEIHNSLKDGVKTILMEYVSSQRITEKEYNNFITK